MSIRLNSEYYNDSIHKRGTVGLGAGEKASSQSDTGFVGNASVPGTYHMADHAELYEIQRGNNFEFVVGFNSTDNLN